MQVDIPVELHQAKIGAESLQTGNYPERDCAVPPEYHRRTAAPGYLLYPIGHSLRHRDHEVEVLLSAVWAAAAMQGQGQVAIVNDVNAGVKQPIDQTCAP